MFPYPFPEAFSGPGAAQMTLDAAAYRLKLATQTVQRRGEAVDALRARLIGLEKEYAEAQQIERAAQRQLIEIAGGRYWDTETSTFKIADSGPFPGEPL